jgi:hypothetical protein
MLIVFSLSLCTFAAPVHATDQNQTDASIAINTTVTVSHTLNKEYTSIAVVIKSTNSENAYTNEALFLYPCKVSDYYPDECQSTHDFIVKIENKEHKAIAIARRCIQSIKIENCAKGMAIGVLHFTTTQRLPVATLSSTQSESAPACAIINTQKKTVCGTFHKDSLTMTLKAAPSDPVKDVIGAVISGGKLIGVAVSSKIDPVPFVTVFPLNKINTVIQKSCTSIFFFVSINCPKSDNPVDTRPKKIPQIPIVLSNLTVPNNHQITADWITALVQRKSSLTARDRTKIRTAYTALSQSAQQTARRAITTACASNTKYVTYRLYVRFSCAQFVKNNQTAEEQLSILRYVEFVPSLKTRTRKEQGL